MFLYLVETFKFEFPQEHDEDLEKGAEHVVKRFRLIPKVNDEEGKAEKIKRILFYLLTCDIKKILNFLILKIFFKGSGSSYFLA